MENKLEEEGKIEVGKIGVIDEGETPDAFICCICLDLLYKPIVLTCGHISCFWCVYISMNFLGNSHCPICRNTYIHFPSICQTLHLLLGKLCPVIYKEREKQILVQEKQRGVFSPQFDSIGSNGKLEEDCVCSTSILNRTSDDSVRCTQTLNDSVVLPPDGLNPQEACEVVLPDEKMFCCGNDKDISVSDVLCVACNQLLYRPIVLHCGHAYCETCVPRCADTVLKCTSCQVVHPSFFVKVCLEFDNFLQMRFPTEYAVRRRGSKGEYQNVKTGNTSTLSSIIHNGLQPHQSEISIHPGAGCDSCGMCPIVGQRYKCKDCHESIGFDLCGECYKTSSKLAGRFNQRHTSDHNFELIKSSTISPLKVFEEPESSSTIPPSMDT